MRFLKNDDFASVVEILAKFTGILKFLLEVSNIYTTTPSPKILPKKEESDNRKIDGSRITDYKNELLGSVMEYYYRSILKLGSNQNDLPEYIPDKNGPNDVKLHIPECYFDYKYSWKNSNKNAEIARDEYNTAAIYLKTAVLEAVNKYLQGNFMLEIKERNEKGEEMMKEAEVDIKNAVSLFLTVAIPIIKDFKPRLCYLQKRIVRNPLNHTVKICYNDTIQIFLNKKSCAAR